MITVIHGMGGRELPRPLRTRKTRFDRLPESRVFYGPAVMKALDDVPAYVSRSDYGCLCIVFTRSPCDLGLWGALVTKRLYAMMDKEPADKWHNVFIEMLTEAQKVGTVVLFPGWTLEP